MIGEPLFSLWRKAFGQPARDLPTIRLEVAARSGRGSFVDPNPWMEARAFDPDGRLVGRVRYGVSPVFDRIYVDGLHIEEEYRGQGSARSLLLTVVQLNSPAGWVLPLTALKELNPHGLWNRLRAGEVPGLVVTQDLSAGEMKDEQRRWQAHLHLLSST